MTTASETIQEAIHTLEELKGKSTTGPLFMDDCEGEIQIFPESLLRRVERDATGAIIMYSPPSSYPAHEMIVEHSLDSMEPGEDHQDDTLRSTLRTLVTLYNTLDQQLTLLRCALKAYQHCEGSNAEPLEHDKAALAVAEALLRP